MAYVQQLQVENSELKVLLEEHQSALELIMNKYQSQVGQCVCYHTYGSTVGIQCICPQN